MAVDNPAGPPPTIQTSYIMTSRGGSSSTVVVIDTGVVVVVVVENNHFVMDDTVKVEFLFLPQHRPYVSVAIDFLVAATTNVRSMRVGRRVERMDVVRQAVLPLMAVLVTVDRIRLVTIIIVGICRY